MDAPRNLGTLFFFKPRSRWLSTLQKNKKSYEAREKYLSHLACLNNVPVFFFPRFPRKIGKKNISHLLRPFRHQFHSSTPSPPNGVSKRRAFSPPQPQPQQLKLQAKIPNCLRDYRLHFIMRRVPLPGGLHAMEGRLCQASLFIQPEYPTEVHASIALDIIRG